MNTLDKRISDSVEAFIPKEPEGYTEMIDGTLAQLKAVETERPKHLPRAWKPIAAAAAVIAAMIISSAAVFTARPALAAEVPGVSRIVYAASGQKKANAADTERIEALLTEAFGSLAFCDYEAAARCFREDEVSDRGNYLSAAYVEHLVAFGDYFPDGANAVKLEIADLQAEQKAFRYTAYAALDLVSRDGARKSREDCTVRLWENPKGLYIESIEFGSAGFKAYASEYENVFGAVPSHGAKLDLIPLDTAFLSYTRVIAGREGARQRADRLEHMLKALYSVNASGHEKAVRESLITAELEKAETDITPEAISAEQLASELMYRYWLGAQTGEARDFSDIMERNEQTDLFYLDALLKAEQIRLGLLKPLISVEAGSAEITGLLEETEDGLKARFRVQTAITDGVSQGVGEEIVLTLRREGAGYKAIGFDRGMEDGIYNYELKPLAERYKAEGRSWQEAGQMAYDEIHARLEREAEQFKAE